MDEVKSTYDSIIEALKGSFSKVGDFLPTLVSALIILIIGWIIAKIVKWAATKILRAVKFDSLADRVGVNEYLVKGGIKKRASGLLATLIYWIIMFTVLVMFFNALGLEVVSDLLNNVVTYIPNIIVACVLLVVGMYLAEFVSGLVVAALKGGSFESYEVVGKIAYFAVMFFTIAIALDQLGIGENIIGNVVTIVLGGLGLAVGLGFGLAFGLGGGKEWLTKLMNKYVNK